VLLRSAATSVQQAMVKVPGDGPATVELYDGAGRLVSTSTTDATGLVRVAVLVGGFTVVRR
jgi:hypothetical protein